MADHPLRPATDRRLGEPLPHQLANQPRAPPGALACKQRPAFLGQTKIQPTYAVLARVSPGYPPFPGRLPTCYSPVRRSPETEASFAHDLHVLSTPPAFILSQDQTLQFKSCAYPSRYSPAGSLFEIYSQLNSSPTAPKRAPPKTNKPGSRAADFTHFSLSSFQRTDAVPFFGANGESTGIAPWPSSPFSVIPNPDILLSVKEPVCCCSQCPAPSGAIKESAWYCLEPALSTPVPPRDFTGRQSGLAEADAAVVGGHLSVAPDRKPSRHRPNFLQ